MLRVQGRSRGNPCWAQTSHHCGMRQLQRCPHWTALQVQQPLSQDEVEERRLAAEAAIDGEAASFEKAFGELPRPTTLRGCILCLLLAVLAKCQVHGTVPHRETALAIQVNLRYR